MKTIEKIKWLNRGIALGKRDCEVCQNLTGAAVGEGTSKRIYCGTEDYVEFFETVISTLGLDVKYEIEDVDGELEIAVF